MFVYKLQLNRDQIYIRVFFRYIFFLFIDLFNESANCSLPLLPLEEFLVVDNHDFLIFSVRKWLFG